jgi:hypothetical protein
VRTYRYQHAICIEKNMKNRTMALKTPVAFCAAISLLSCSTSVEDKNIPSNARTNLEFGTTVSALTGRPTPLTPASDQDVTAIFTYTWTLADDNADRIQIWINHTNGTDNPILTRAAANCASPDLDCTYTSPALGGGNARWWLLAFDDNDGTNSGWTTGINYTVENTARAVLVAPTAGNIPITSFNPPDFSWTGVASSSSYTLWVADSDPSNNTADFEVSYTPAQAGCVSPDDTCFLTGAFLTAEAFPALANGRVDWFIQTSNDNWSIEGQFTLVAPCANDPLGATCDDSNSCTDDSCDTGTDPAGVCVNADNASACDDQNACTTGDICNSGQCRATDQAACTVSNTGALPAGVTLDVNQDYTWPEVAGVLSYRVVVQNRDTNQYVLNGTDGSSVLATNVCAGGICAIEPGQLPNGRFRWWVQTPPLVGGCCTLLNGHETWHGPWMTGVTFEVGRSERPTAIAPLNMQTTIDQTPDLTWTAIGGQNHNYDVWITDANGVSTETRITSGAATCPFVGNTCRLTAATLPLGTTYWWVEANDSALWSTRSTFVIE